MDRIARSASRPDQDERRSWSETIGVAGLTILAVAIVSLMAVALSLA